MPNVIEFAGKNDSVVGTKIPERLKDRLDEIANGEDRTVSYVIRALILRGLSLYEQDGKLRGEAPKQTQALRMLAPVVARIESGQMKKEEVQRLIDAADIQEIEKRLKTRRIPVGKKAKA